MIVNPDFDSLSNLLESIKPIPISVEPSDLPHPLKHFLFVVPDIKPQVLVDVE